MTRALATILLITSASIAQAQDDTLPLTLIAEATFNKEDHAAILHVLQRRADRAGVSIERMARLYSAAWKRREIPARVLDAVSTKPDEYQALLDRIERFRRGELPDPCRGASMHWGDRHGDLQRARRAGWKRLKCGSANLFWALR